MNHKKLYRLYREEGLSVRLRRGRKRARGSRTPMPVPLRPNDRWSMDFVADTFGASRRLRILAINDDFCRENLCLVGDTSMSAFGWRASWTRWRPWLALMKPTAATRPCLHQGHSGSRNGASQCAMVPSSPAGRS